MEDILKGSGDWFGFSWFFMRKSCADCGPDSPEMPEGWRGRFPGILFLLQDYAESRSFAFCTEHLKPCINSLQEFRANMQAQSGSRLPIGTIGSLHLRLKYCGNQLLIYAYTLIGNRQRNGVSALHNFYTYRAFTMREFDRVTDQIAQHGCDDIGVTRDFITIICKY